MDNNELIWYCDCCQTPIHVGDWVAEYQDTGTVVCENCDSNLNNVFILTDEFFDH